MNKTVKNILSLKSLYEEEAGKLWRVITTDDMYFLLCWFNPNTTEVEVKLVDAFMSEVSNYEALHGSLLVKFGTLRTQIELWNEDETNPYPERDEEAELIFNKVVNGTSDSPEVNYPIKPLSLDPDDYMQEQK